MYNVVEFIKWALTHVDPESIPEGASLPLPIEECGVQPLHYLYGAVMRRTTRETLNERYVNHYCKTMTRETYDNLTSSFHENDFATDCQGLLDAWLTEQGEPTDINANMNYNSWCTSRRKIDKTDYPYVIGEALFSYNSIKGKMTHVGWICGFDADGEPLAVEARGIWYGVVVTKLSDRAWTHRGLMTKKFNYESEEDTIMDCTKFEVKTPMLNGEGAKAMQAALNANGYTDSNDKQLVEDGKWGAKSQAAFEKMLTNHSDKSPKGVPTFCIDSIDGRHKLKLSIAEVKAI